MSKRKTDQDGVYRRPNTKMWWVSYIDGSGKRTRRSTGTTDRQEAAALLAKWKLEAHREKQWGEAPVHTFDELMLRYLEETQSRKRSAEIDRQIARRLYPYFSGCEMEALSAPDVHGYISQRRRDGVQDTTIRRELALVSTAIGYANRWWDWSLPNPVSGRKPPRDKGRVRWLTQEEAQRLIACAVWNERAPYLASFIRLALHTGMRKGEMLGLEWQRMSFADGLIYLEPQHTKTNERRTVPLNKNAKAALTELARYRAEHCPDSPWVFCNKTGQRIKNVRRSFASACRAANIDDFHPHDLRHTCAAWLVTAGVPLPEVRDLLGHHTIQMTERYAHLAPDNVRAAVAVLETASHFGHSNEIAEGERRCKSLN